VCGRNPDRGLGKKHDLPQRIGEEKYL